jgi:hypothetical protein
MSAFKTAEQTKMRATPINSWYHISRKPGLQVISVNSGKLDLASCKYSAAKEKRYSRLS